MGLGTARPLVISAIVGFALASCEQRGAESQSVSSSGTALASTRCVVDSKLSSGSATAGSAPFVPDGGGPPSWVGRGIGVLVLGHAAPNREGERVTVQVEGGSNKSKRGTMIRKHLVDCRESRAPAATAGRTPPTRESSRLGGIENIQLRTGALPIVPHFLEPDGSVPVVSPPLHLSNVCERGAISAVEGNLAISYSPAVSFIVTCIGGRPGGALRTGFFVDWPRLVPSDRLAYGEPRGPFTYQGQRVLHAGIYRLEGVVRTVVAAASNEGSPFFHELVLYEIQPPRVETGAARTPECGPPALESKNDCFFDGVRVRLSRPGFYNEIEFVSVDSAGLEIETRKVPLARIELP